MKHVLVTGGCGYTGTPLTRNLLEAGHRVTVFDTQWFGNHLPPHPNLILVKGDVRDIRNIPLDGMDAIIHLANVANDPAVDLDPSLSWEVNALVAMQLADQAVRKGVKHFIFASSGSVYGVKEEERVTEDLELIPISVYNKTKMVAERVLLSYTGAMTVHCVRPATVCGYSPRMRLDVAVNMLTFQALQNKRITVFGGDQTRPNIHIADLADVYLHLLDNPQVPSGCYNAGFENISILEIAKRVTELVPAEIVVSPSNDPRSYRLDSSKLLATGFSPKRSVSQAIEELIKYFHEGVLRDDGTSHNVKWMRKLIADKVLA